MPKVRYMGQIKRDPLKGLILEYLNNKKISKTELASLSGISRSTLYEKINNQHTSEWLTEAVRICKLIGIPIDETRKAITY